MKSWLLYYFNPLKILNISQLLWTAKEKSETMTRLCLFSWIIFQTQTVCCIPKECNLLEIFPENKSIKCKNSGTQWSRHTLFLCSKLQIIFWEMTHFFQLEYSISFINERANSYFNSIPCHNLCFLMFNKLHIHFGIICFCEQSGSE